MRDKHHARRDGVKMICALMNPLLFFKNVDVILNKLLDVFRITRPGLTVEATIIKQLVCEFFVFFVC